VKYKADVTVTLKDGIRDPQGAAIETVLKRTGMEAGVSAGKFFSVSVDGASEDDARLKLETICREVLSNPVLEKFEIEKFYGVN
jgi:phosphoribosylformylglycinamidine synthase